MSLIVNLERVEFLRLHGLAPWLGPEAARRRTACWQSARCTQERILKIFWNHWAERSGPSGSTKSSRESGRSRRKAVGGKDVSPGAKRAEGFGPSGRRGSDGTAGENVRPGCSGTLALQELFRQSTRRRPAPAGLLRAAIMSRSFHLPDRDVGEWRRQPVTVFLVLRGVPFIRRRRS